MIEKQTLSSRETKYLLGFHPTQISRSVTTEELYFEKGLISCQNK